MDTSSRTRYYLAQKEVEDRMLIRDYRPSVIRVPSQAESINSLDFENHLKNSVENLVQQRQPVQHHDRSYTAPEPSSSHRSQTNYSPDSADHHHHQLSSLSSSDDSFVIAASLGDCSLNSDLTSPAEYPRRQPQTHFEYQCNETGTGHGRPCHNDEKIGHDHASSDIGLQQSLQNISRPPPINKQKSYSSSHSTSNGTFHRHEAHSMPNNWNQHGQIRSNPDAREMGYATQQLYKQRIPSASAEIPSHLSSDVSGSYSFSTVHPSYEDRNVETKPHTVQASPSSAQNEPSTSNAQSTQPNNPLNSTSTRKFLTPVPQSPTPFTREQIKVFITYAKEPGNPLHVRTVVQISQTLMNNHIDVIVDVLEQNVRAMSISDWLENNISSSQFILICISPGYRKVVDGSHDDLPNAREEAVNTQYIYRRIHNDYIKEGSKNYRYIPVLVSGAKIDHIPPWLRDTKVFKWPDDYEDIIYRLYRQEKFIKPPIGEPPTHTVKRYSTDVEGRDRKDSENDDRTQQKPSCR